MAGQSGGYAMLRFTKRDLYNYMHGQRVARICDGDATATISYLEGKANADMMTVARYTRTVENRLGSLFWADGEMISDYQWSQLSFPAPTSLSPQLHTNIVEIDISSHTRPHTEPFRCSHDNYYFSTAVRHTPPHYDATSARTLDPSMRLHSIPQMARSAQVTLTQVQWSTFSSMSESFPRIQESKQTECLCELTLSLAKLSVKIP
ncbi:hypothetical protein AHAS_Ahas04G0103700 [Arachis hypogaea]